MDNIYMSLEEECKKAGTNLTRICSKAGVCRSTVQRWKHKEPNTILLYRRIKAMIEVEAANNKNNRQTEPHD